MSQQLEKQYSPAGVEGRIYRRWEAAGSFRPDGRPDAAPYTIVMPPPNVTGSLHMGHALNNTLQDLVIRYRRMLGDAALWVPGTDHAGIATQAVVEKRLFQEKNLRRQEMGREKFLEEVWTWKEKYGDTILEQLRRLGCSADWSRTRFTLDKGLSWAVRKAFVGLWEKGLIYRGTRLVNWDTVLQTAVSDDEIEYVDRQGHLWYIRYPLAEGQGHLTVATTRPETMLGDTAVAVHPEDDRHRKLIGKTVNLPLMNRPIKVIADETVEREFGTGAVKVTPGHDPTDYERGQRFDLEIVSVFTVDGKISENGGPYQGMTILEARKKVVADLQAQGLMEKIEDHSHRVAISDRSKSPIEPLISEQWFVKMRPLAKPAIKALEEGKLQFVPKRWGKVYLDWLTNVKDWCISRQLWWGHRIPVWYDEDGQTIASLRNLEIGEVHPHTGKPIVRQDPDVLDTWASSWLWPFSVLGWPEDSEDMQRFYPTQFLATAREIIYLWVARMVMAGYVFMDQLPEEKRCPFTTVYINGTVLDSIGRRMSKSLGNGIDPLEMIDKYGADAVRFTLASLASENQDIKLAETRFEASRNFANKLWNAARFVQMNLEGYRDPGNWQEGGQLCLADQWILSRLQTAVQQATKALDDFQFNEAARVVYDFTWRDFCDWYLEFAKTRLALQGPKRHTTQRVMATVLDHVLRLLHPIMPFISEALWESLNKTAPMRGYPQAAEDGGLLIISKWPTVDQSLFDPELESKVERLKTIIRGVRDIRNKMGLSESVSVELLISTQRSEIIDEIDSNREFLTVLGNINNLTFGADVEKPPSSATQVFGDIRLYVPLAGLIDIEAERQRLEKRINKAVKLLQQKKGKLENSAFVSKAPPHVVEKERQSCRQVQGELEMLRETLADL